MGEVFVFMDSLAAIMDFLALLQQVWVCLGFDLLSLASLCEVLLALLSIFLFIQSCANFKFTVP